MASQHVSPLGPRNNNECSGWKCLTEAEQCGIISSIVITSIVLILAYMYYLGRITSAHQEIVLARRRRRRRRRRARLANISVSQLPAVPQYPSQSHQVVYQPVFYSLGSTPFSHPRAQVPPGPLPPQPVPIIYPTSPIPPRPTYVAIPHIRPGGPQGNPRSNPRGRPVQRHPPSESSYPSLSPSQSQGLPPRQPTWRQRLCRAFGLPVGRASTIASSAPGTPIRSRSASAGGRENTRRSLSTSQRAEHSHVSRKSQESRRSRGRSDKARYSNDHDREDEPRPESPDTNVATVHSDDYQLNPIPEPVSDGRGPVRDEQWPLTTIPQGKEKGGSSSLSSDIYSDGRQTLPTISSIRPAFDTRARPAHLPEELGGGSYTPMARPGTSTVSEDREMRASVYRNHRGREDRRKHWER
ncbi:hypothetical protein LCI18_001155 [Fusarium solani-melongenae]|uniref:Uncharacterized protein n=1 Tax=Fusarium solani subsp. cucurbitae TaxID=2747967 RepID=A0ACD3YMV4_FUSSC|nr:hypothetical protein LCI18_001155 [Fusarium solani-melongenae]